MLLHYTAVACPSRVLLWLPTLLANTVLFIIYIFLRGRFYACVFINGFRRRHLAVHNVDEPLLVHECELKSRPAMLIFCTAVIGSVALVVGATTVDVLYVFAVAVEYDLAVRMQAETGKIAK